MNESEVIKRVFNGGETGGTRKLWMYLTYVDT